MILGWYLVLMGSLYGSFFSRKDTKERSAVSEIVVYCRVGRTCPLWPKRPAEFGACALRRNVSMSPTICTICVADLCPQPEICWPYFLGGK